MVESYTNIFSLLVSGLPPKIPVVSPKSGSIFEKELIQQYINEHHKDPINSEPLTLEELIEIKVSPYQPPRQPTLNSIPSLLSSLQNEWDSVALELFQLRKQLDDTRKELSTALYHHDAAVRVASKAIKQRDEARAALQELTLSISNGKSIETEQVTTNGDNDVQLTDSAPSEEIAQLITSANEELFAIHKAQKNKVNVNITTPLSGIHAVGKHESKPYKRIVASSIVGGEVFLTSSTGLTSVYDVESQSYHKNDSITKNKNISIITEVLHNGSTSTLVGTSTGDLIIDNDVKLGVNVHQEALVSIIPHPSLKNLVFSIDKSGKYALHDINTLVTLFHGKLNGNIVSASIHTDGALVAVADGDGTISIIDLRSNEVVKKLETPNSELSDVKFGPNGYWLIGAYSSASSNFIKVWDLRKDSSETIELIHNTHKIITDKSSQLVFTLGDSTVEIAQYNKKGKEWVLKTMNDPLKVEIDGAIVDGVLVDDSKEDEIQLAIVSDSSSVRQFKISNN